MLDVQFTPATDIDGVHTSAHLRINLTGGRVVEVEETGVWASEGVPDEITRNAGELFRMYVLRYEVTRILGNIDEILEGDIPNYDHTL